MDIFYDEDYTFPILFSCSNIDYTNVVLYENKDIRYRIYNYINVDDNVSLALSSKALYLDTRNWFKLYFPLSETDKDIDIVLKSIRKCGLCRSKSKKHVLFRTLWSENVSIDRSILLYLKQQQGNPIKIPRITRSISHKIPDSIGINIISFRLDREDYDPPLKSIYRGGEDIKAGLCFHRTFCWKCKYLTRLGMIKFNVSSPQ